VCIGRPPSVPRQAGSEVFGEGRPLTRSVRTAKATNRQDQPNGTPAPGQIGWMPIVPIVDLLRDDATRGTGGGDRRCFGFQLNGGTVENDATNGE
jgi:hypothetical protein